MRPASNFTTAASGAGFWHLSSPMPYLFGGLALMLGIITVALIILACSYKKSLSNNESRESGHEQKSGESKQVEIMVDYDKPKIVVIMAGDENPSFLAEPKPKPEPELLICNCQKIEQV